jgi:hypothetical protein
MTGEPRAQAGVISIERFLVEIEHARVAAALAAIVGIGAFGRERAWIDIGIDTGIVVRLRLGTGLGHDGGLRAVTLIVR